MAAEKGIMQDLNNRLDPYAIHPLILGRWSPRSFQNKAVAEEDLLAVLDAARWAPSCFNEQPWRFIVARTTTDLEKMQACLTPQNQEWANSAPVLIAVLSAPYFMETGKENRWSEFDSGTAWGYLALEAKHRGLIAHAMGGFSRKRLREAFGIPLDWGAHAIVALGFQGEASQLPILIAERELPTQRKSLDELWSEGRFAF